MSGVVGGGEGGLVSGGNVNSWARGDADGLGCSSSDIADHIGNDVDGGKGSGVVIGGRSDLGGHGRK